MNTKRILSGYEIVAKGATKVESTLPESGVKDVFPNKSWLEDKQIQAAIEARKHIIEVERIDKSGALNHAEWKEELQLAEVTHNVGSCWQYLGQMKDKKLYLKPEEALFLLEINSLCLKHNDVKVSLQQAYTLLLRDKIALLQYKVYASLSRVGYRVFRHSTPETNNSDHRENTYQNVDKNIKTEEVSVGTSVNTDKDESVDQETDNSDLKQAEESQDIIEIMQEVQKDSVNGMDSMQDENTKFSNQIKQKKVCNFKQLQRLKKRQLKPCNAQILHEYFEGIPELLDNNIVDIKAPDKNVLPNSIILTKSIYKVNLASLKKKERAATPSSNETNNYNVNDEVNGSHIRRLRSTSNRPEFNCTPPNAAFPQNTQYRPSQWRPRQPFYNHNYNFIYFNMLFQRPFLPSWHFAPNFNFYPQPQNNFWRPNLNNQQTQNNFWRPNFNNQQTQNTLCRPNLNNQQTQSNFWRPNLNSSRSNNNRKRSRKSAKKQHLNGILKLAAKLKRLVLLEKSNEGDIYALNKLIHTYNKTYNTKIRLNDQFEIIIEETVVDTITLDDDDEGPSSKRLKPDPSFEENLDNLKMFALKIKDLEHQGKSSGKHRRAFSKLLKTFNDSYNEEYYLNEYYEIACRNQIDLDTSDSDLDCVIEETPSVSSKKLKNPFNILKRLSETQKPSSEVDLNPNENTITNKKYSELTLNTFSKDWLPHEDDFGRAEIIRKDDCNYEVIDIRREEFLYDFIKIQSCKYDNWLDLKKSFLNSIQAAIVEFQHNMPASAKMEIDSIVKIEDCSNMESVLKKLSIIKSDRRVADECNVTIDFDVYNRDVQNFRKSNRPTPHFRVICLNESTNLPSGEQIAALHSKYGDQVATVFAIVGLDSISYVQINPTDLPVHISNVNSI